MWPQQERVREKEEEKVRMPFPIPYSLLFIISPVLQEKINIKK